MPSPKEICKKAISQLSAAARWPLKRLRYGKELKEKGFTKREVYEAGHDKD